MTDSLDDLNKAAKDVVELQRLLVRINQTVSRIYPGYRAKVTVPMMTTDRLIEQGYRYFAPRGVRSSDKPRISPAIQFQVMRAYVPTRLIVEAKAYPRAFQLNNQSCGLSFAARRTPPGLAPWHFGYSRIEDKTNHKRVYLGRGLSQLPPY